MLRVEYNNIGVFGLESILDGLADLKYLYVGGNPLGDEGLTALAKASGKLKLSTLGVDYCGAGPRGLTDIARHATSLEGLYINGNRVDEQVAEAIASNLKQLK